MLFTPGKIPVQKKIEREEKQDLTRVAGVWENEGKTLAWGYVSTAGKLTPAQIEIVKREMNWKNWQPLKVEQVRCRMKHKKCAQIVQELKHIPGMSERTVKGLHAALSKAGVGVK